MSSTAGDTWTKTDQASAFGYSLAFFNSTPELKKLLDQAVSGNWDSTRFAAAFRNTQWFAKNSDTYRQYLALQKSDPATFAQRNTAMQSKVTDLAARLGAPQDSKTVNGIATSALQFGWSDQQIQDAVAGTVNLGKALSGGALTAQGTVAQALSDYGVTMSSATQGHYIRGLLQGTMSAADVSAAARQLAIGTYPALAQALNSGQTLKQIADPYIQSYAQTLEVDPNTVKVTDPLVQQALQSTDAKGTPAQQPLWKFQQTLRADPRWKQTQNAQDALMTQTTSLLKNMGLIS